MCDWDDLKVTDAFSWYNQPQTRREKGEISYSLLRYSKYTTETLKGEK